MKIKKLDESNKTDDYLSIREINWLKDNPGQEIKKTHYTVSYNDYVNANTNKPIGGHFTVIENKGRDTTRVNGVQELKDYIVRRYNKYFKESISSNEPVVKFQGKSSHTFTKDKKWEVDFDEAGNIVARTRYGRPLYFKGHINDKVNDFPSTDEDNIILAAREQHRLKFGEKDLSRVDDLYEGSIPRNASRIRATDRVSKKSMDLHKHGKYWRDDGDEFSYKAYDPAYLRKWNDIEVLETDPNYKPNRTKPEYVVQGNYGYGWEDLTASDNQAEARNDLKAYRENESSVPHRLITRRVPVTENLKESFKPSDSGIQSVKCYNQYNYTIQELRVDNDNKTFERGQFTMGKPDKKTKNRQEFEDIVDTLKELGYTEIKSDYRSMRNKSRKGVPTNESIKIFGAKGNKKLTEASKGFEKEFYNDYVILKNRAGDGYDIYSYDGTPEKVTRAHLEDEGYATLKDAKAEIDKWVEQPMNEASYGGALNESATEDAQPIETDSAYGIASIINGLIVDEYEAIEGYNTAIVNAQEEGYDEMVKVLTEIQAEENIHVGQLVELMKMVDPNADKIIDGMEEGKEQLSSEPENKSKINVVEKLYKKVVKRK